GVLTTCALPAFRAGRRGDPPLPWSGAEPTSPPQRGCDVHPAGRSRSARRAYCEASLPPPPPRWHIRPPLDAATTTRPYQRVSYGPDSWHENAAHNASARPATISRTCSDAAATRVLSRPSSSRNSRPDALAGTTPEPTSLLTAITGKIGRASCRESEQD